jgi:hypothetical protein
MTPTKYFPNIFNMDIKKCRIWCQFETLKKYHESLHKKKVWVLRTYVLSTKRWKST